MSIFTMVVWIVLICVVGNLWSKHLKHKRQGSNSQHKEIESLLAQNKALQEEMTQLKERVQVLETIVTDEGYDLKKTINGL